MAPTREVLARVASALGASFRAEKAPYVVTLFVAALGWTALRTSDRLQRTPFVEYQAALENVESLGGAQHALVRLRNVTSSQLFECYRIELVSPKAALSDNSVDQRVVINSPVAARTRVEAAQSSNWRWEVRDFMPGADLTIGAPLKKGAFQILVRPCEPVSPPSTSNAKDSAQYPKPFTTPILLRRSFVTWYVENELAVLWGGLLWWLLLLVGLNALKSSAANVSPVRRLPPSTFRR